MKVLLTGAAFVGGVYAGLWLAATAAREAGCPAAKRSAEERAKKRKKAPESAEERARSAVDDIISTLGAVRQRSTRTEPGGSSS